MVALLNTSDYDDYNDSVVIPSMSPVNKEMYQMRTGFSFMYVLVYSTNLLLGLLLNSAVIFMTLWKYRSKKKLNRRMLILGLAATHLIFCLITPLYLNTAWNYFSWQFGQFACKLGSFMMFMNMFSASVMITFWNVRWCVPSCFEHHMSSSMVLLSWFAGAILSAPSFLSREVQYTADGDTCLDNYDYSEQPQISEKGVARMQVVVTCRLIFGLLLPLVVTCVSCCFMNSWGNNQVRSLIIRPVTIAHFLCWAPVLCLSMLQVIVRTDNRWFSYALPPATALSVLNSCIYPIICIWQGNKELKRNLRPRPEILANVYEL